MDKTDNWILSMDGRTKLNKYRAYCSLFFTR